MAADSEEFPHFINANGQKIFCKYWEPTSDIRALAFIIHGFGEHVQRYDKVAHVLTDLGMKVCGHDHIGHGKSDGERAVVEEIAFYVRDSFQHIDLMKKKHPDLPLYVVSHSMGGLINILMANERPKEFINVLISPLVMLNPKQATPLAVWGAKLASFCLPNKQLSKVDSKRLTRDPVQAKDYDDDPLNYHGGIRIGMVLKLYNATQEVQRSIPSIEWPFLVLHGDDDELCYFEGSKKLYKDAKSTIKTLKIYEGYYHELDKEPEEYAKVVLDDMREWISDRLDGKPLSPDEIETKIADGGMEKGVDEGEGKSEEAGSGETEDKGKSKGKAEDEGKEDAAAAGDNKTEVAEGE